MNADIWGLIGIGATLIVAIIGYLFKLCVKLEEIRSEVESLRKTIAKKEN